MTSKGLRGAPLRPGQRHGRRPRLDWLRRARRLTIITVACWALAMPLAASPGVAHAASAMRPASVPAPSAAATATAGPATAKESTGITAVAATNSEVTIIGSAAVGARVEIRSWGTWQAADVIADSDQVGTTVTDAAGGFSLTVPRTAPNGGDRIYDRFGAVVDGVAHGVVRG